MRFQCLGHASVRLEIGDQVLLIDPWVDGPKFPKDPAAVEGATAILMTHGHFDHVQGAPELAARLGVPVYGVPELMGLWSDFFGLETVGFNKGGSVVLGNVAVTAVAASHSTDYMHDGQVHFAGDPVGFMIEGEGRCVYVSGDTDVMADMAIWQELHEPEIGILCAGGHYTMDMKRAAYAASNLLKLKTVIPYHYQTFPVLAQSADVLRDALPGVRVIEPEIGEVVDL